jgi:hypothetical protein
MDHDLNFQNIPSARIFDAASELPLADAVLLEENVRLIQDDIISLRESFRSRLSETTSQQWSSVPFQLNWKPLDNSSAPYAQLCSSLSNAERALLLFGLLPHYAPEVLRDLVAPVQDGLIITNYHIGGFVKRTSQQFIPNLQTVLFTLAGADKYAQQMAYRELILEGSLLKRQIVTLRAFEYSEPVISDKELIPDLAEEFVHFLLQGRQPRPDFGKNFPAKLLTTDKTWEQLILSGRTLNQLELLVDWLQHGRALAEESKGYFGAGYPALFFGPPGTGKSMTAALIGKRCNLNVFRVDSSRVVSKYIGETEKNLVQLFQRMKVENARSQEKPILFFDEADVLFSKRTDVKDAKDKWANMETSVLLPLIEDYDGLAIIATNLEHNLDVAMDRRLQLKIKFPVPAYSERLRVWESALPPVYNYSGKNSCEELARYRLSPASIINILKGGCLQARKRGSYTVTRKDLEHYVALEFSKSGITPSWDNIPAIIN